MVSKQLAVAFVAVGATLAAASLPATAKMGPADAVAAYDTDRDGTLDWKEISAAATAKFDAADHDHDGTLDAKEAATLGISARQLRKADPDKDGTLDKNEYLAIVKAKFEAADHDHDGSVTPAELTALRGRGLMKLLQ